MSIEKANLFKDVDLKTIHAELVKCLSRSKNISQPVQEASWIIKHCLNVDITSVLAEDRVTMSENTLLAFFAAVEKRLAGVPLAYAIGEIDFCDLKLDMFAPILIPRPETEEWVLNLLDYLNNLKSEDLKILDLCSGSGCISLSLAKAFEKASVLGVDISRDAVNVSRHNQEKNKVENCKFTKSNLFLKVREESDLIVSNPPYLSEQEYVNLDASVADWEDKRALFGGQDGLEFYRKIVSQAKLYLTDRLPKKGYSNLFLEIGYKQAEEIVELMKEAEFKNIEIRKDLSGKDRVISCQVF